MLFLPSATSRPTCALLENVSIKPHAVVHLKGSELEPPDCSLPLVNTRFSFDSDHVIGFGRLLPEFREQDRGSVTDEDDLHAVAGHRTYLGDDRHI